jgi:CRISPR-associated endonuclease Csn1
VRNPAVERALTETRKVVNAIVKKYGKPLAIRVELARDLKKNRKERKEIFQSLFNN